MRVSICNEVIAGLPFAQQCEFAKKVGYDGVELAPFTLSDEPHLLPPARRAELRSAASAAGLPITSLHYLLRKPDGLSITSAETGQRTRTIDVMRRLIELAAELGAKVLVHGSPAARKLAPGQEADDRKRGVESFAAIAPDAERANVIYCIEPLSTKETTFINTVAEAAEIVRAIDSRAVRAMIDCSAAGQMEIESVATVIRQWVPTGLIGHIHFNDPNRRGPGEGALAFAPILAALRDVKYPGDSAIEPFIYHPDGPTCAARGIGYIRGLMENHP
jgi:D-psicose/D-tagatose/L-ribulose 3-epimerase